MAFRSKLLALFAALFASLFLWPSSSSAMEYAVVENDAGKRILMMVGPIETDEFESFKRAVQNSGRIEGFWLSSGGGSVGAATQMGHAIRSSRLPVAVPSLDRMEKALLAAQYARQTVTGALEISAHMGQLRKHRGRNHCASACGILLSSGLLRFVDQPLSVGLHSAYIPPEKLGDFMRRAGGADNGIKRLQQQMQVLGVEAATHMQDMGVNPLYARVAAAVPSECMYWLSASELDVLNVVNVQGLKTQGPPGPGRCSCKSEALIEQCRANLSRVRG